MTVVNVEFRQRWRNSAFAEIWINNINRTRTKTHYYDASGPRIKKVNGILLTRPTIASF